MSGPRRWRSWWVLVMLLSLGTALAAAQWRHPTIALAPGAVQSWADASGRAALDQAQAAFARGQGRTADWRTVAPLGRGRAMWYRLTLPRVVAPAQAVLTVPIASIDLVELFQPDAAGAWSVQRAGDAIPVGEWPIPYLHPAFAVPLVPGDSPRLAYVRVQHSHPLSLQIVLRDAAAFNESNKLWHLLLGGYIGFLVLVAVLAIAHAVLWRDVIHLYYGAHVVLVGLLVLSLTGLAGEYMWPWNAWWNDIAPAVLSATALGGVGLFVRELVAERGRRALSLLLLVLSVIAFAIALAFVELGRPPVFLVHNINAAVSLGVLLIAVGWYAVRQPQVGVWVFAGMALLALGAVFPVLRNLGFDPPAFMAQYGLQLGAALEIPLVLVGLYFRSRERRDNQLRVTALARTDPLTGVASHRVLTERLDQLLERRRRDPLAGALLRVRVANLSSIANDYGREAAEAAMVRAAECVAQRAREGDTVARERGGDLVLVLQGRITRAQALANGRDIIAAGLKFSGRLPPGVTLALHVAGACAPMPRGTGQVLLALLGEILQEIGEEAGGRAMRIVQAPDEND
ncbi:MAG TPA: 7TM diverse intracellular signaling domain-containing protein [Ramlibacter sp.]|nr:7TM diverse intracellular signaling domain-containing protein [Ramlibacter sp.]